MFTFWKDVGRMSTKCRRLITIAMVQNELRHILNKKKSLIVETKLNNSVNSKTFPRLNFIAVNNTGNSVGLSSTCVMSVT